MPENAKITFYRVDQCGYYGQREENPQFGALAAILPDLTTWVRRDNKPLVDTHTFEVPDDSDFLPIYCHNIRHNQAHNEYLITTWNATPAIDGQTASVSANQPVGHAQVYLNGVRANTIAGFPTYFWMIPARNLLATIRFDHPQNGQKGLCQYVRSFLQKYSSHVMLDPAWDGTGEMPIVGYCLQPGAETQRLRPSFRTSLYRQPGALAKIRRERPRIRKLLRKNHISVAQQNDVALWQRMLRGVGLSAPPATRNEAKVKWELEFTPTEPQLEQIIAKWEEEHDLQWDDVGFVLEGEQTPLWLSHVFAKTEIEVDVQRRNAAIVADDSLLAALQANRARLLELVPGER